jgi:glutamate racemase
VIPKILKNGNIEIIDSAESIAESAKAKLGEMKLLNEKGGDFQCFVSDRPQRFHELAERFLGRQLKSVEVVALD